MSNSEYTTLVSMINALSTRINTLDAKCNTKESSHEADLRENRFNADINEMNSSIDDIAQKVAVVQMPEETRMYLTSGELKQTKELMIQMRTLKHEAENVLATILSKIKYISIETE